jgi:hypothetical protein
MTNSRTVPEMAVLAFGGSYIRGPKGEFGFPGPGDLSSAGFLKN